MAMQPPPSRYKVVERGRRLEVIDTRNGEPVRPPLTASPAERRTSPMLRKLGSGDGTRFTTSPLYDAKGPRTIKLGSGDGTRFTTSPLYDAKGPRTIKLDYSAMARLRQLRFAVAIGVAVMIAIAFLAWWMIPVAIVAIANAKTRSGVRAAITRWFDGFDQAARDSSRSG
jgi:hypothetical protein